MNLDPQRIVPVPGQNLPTYTPPRPAPKHTQDIPRALINQQVPKADRFYADIIKQEQYLRESKARKLEEARRYAAANGDSSRLFLFPSLT